MENTAGPIRVDRSDNRIRRIVVIQTAYIGDVILTEPLIRQCAALFPDAEIDVIVRPQAAELLETHPAVERVIVFDKHGAQAGLSGLLRLGRSLQRRCYDLALLPHRSLRSGLLARLAKIPRRIGFNRGGGRILHSKVVHYPCGHEVQRNLALLSHFGTANGEVKPAVFTTSADEARAVEIIRYVQQSMPERKAAIIAIAPGSRWATKRWPENYFAALIRRFTHTTANKIVLIGGKEDHPLCERITAAAEGACRNLAGKLHLRESVAFLRHCALLVTNDSAPTHLGVAAGCRVITIFGATVPAFGFYPNGPGDRIVETNLRLPCRPCGVHGGKRCPQGHFQCMRSIDPEQVFRLIEASLGSPHQEQA